MDHELQSQGMQVVLITGCGSGLGNAFARAFNRQSTFRAARSRFRVFASDVQLHSLQDLSLEGIDILQLDVTSDESVRQAVNHVVQEAGQIDILICNAGIVTIAPLIEEERSEINKVLNVNT